MNLEIGHLLQFSFAAYKFMSYSVSECACFIVDEFYQY